jgi:hypothetical protein
MITPKTSTQEKALAAFVAKKAEIDPPPGAQR